MLVTFRVADSCGLYVWRRGIKPKFGPSRHVVSELSHDHWTHFKFHLSPARLSSSLASPPPIYPIRTSNFWVKRFEDLERDRRKVARVSATGRTWRNNSVLSGPWFEHLSHRPSLCNYWFSWPNSPLTLRDSAGECEGRKCLLSPSRSARRATLLRSSMFERNFLRVCVTAEHTRDCNSPRGSNVMNAED